MTTHGSFLMANYRWIESYCSEAGVDPSQGKLEQFQRVFQDFPCSFAIDMAGLHHDILVELKNKAWQKTSKGVLTRKNLSLMDREEYARFLSEPKRFIQETVLQRLYEVPLTPDLLREKAKIYFASIEKENAIYKELSQRGYDVRSYLILGAPLDLLADFLRGTKELLTDLHSVPDLVAASCEVLLDLVVGQANAMKKYYGIEDLLLPLHLPTLMSRRDYQEFYHPTYHRLVSRLLQEGYRILVMVEGNGDRFVDLLAEVDSPRLLMHFEETSLERCISHFRNKKTQISGFYPTHLLQYGDLEECLETARWMKTMLQDMPNYIFSTNKALLGLEDGESHRIKKVYDCFANG